METLSFFEAILGGALIGLASAGVVLVQKRVAGISGIAGGLLSPQSGDVSWRAAFLAGLVLSGILLFPIVPGAFSSEGAPGLGWVGLAGLLVGFGTRLGNGCTSGHGVCGVGRLSTRSLAATATFMVAAALTVYLMRGFSAGAP